MDKDFIIEHLISNFDVIKAIGYTHSKYWNGYMLDDEDDFKRLVYELYESAYKNMVKGIDTYTSSGGFRIGMYNKEAYLCFDHIGTIRNAGNFGIENCQVYYKFKPFQYIRSAKIKKIKSNFKKI